MLGSIIKKIYSKTFLYELVREKEKKIIEQVQIYIENSKYETLAEYEELKKNSPSIVTKEELLEKIIEKKASIARYGDGELMLMFNKNIPLQERNELLVKKLIKIVEDGSTDNLFICLPNIFGSLKNFIPASQNSMRGYMHLYREKIVSHMNPNSLYYDSYISRPYYVYKNKDKVLHQAYFDRIKKIWEERNILLVEGEHTRFGMGNDLLNNAKSVQRVLCPNKDAFSKYEEIVTYVKTFPQENTLVLLALGATATAMSVDLHNAGYQSIDIGNLDVEYEWFLAGVTRKSKVKGRQVIECGGADHVQDADDTYKEQIVHRFC